MKAFLQRILQEIMKKIIHTVKLGNKERLHKEQIGIKEPFPVTNLLQMIILENELFFHTNDS